MRYAAGEARARLGEGHTQVRLVYGGEVGIFHLVLERLREGD